MQKVTICGKFEVVGVSEEHKRNKIKFSVICLVHASKQRRRRHQNRIHKDVGTVRKDEGSEEQKIASAAFSLSSSPSPSSLSSFPA